MFSFTLNMYAEEILNIIFFLPLIALQRSVNIIYR